MQVTLQLSCKKKKLPNLIFNHSSAGRHQNILLSCKILNY